MRAAIGAVYMLVGLLLTPRHHGKAQAGSEDAALAQVGDDGGRARRIADEKRNDGMLAGDGL